MARMDPSEIRFELDDSVNEVFDELPGSSFLALRKLCWNGSGNFKLDIRKWYTDKLGNEVPGKGVSFMTEEGPANLIEALLKNGYGDTRKTLNGISEREDFIPEVARTLNSLGIDVLKTSEYLQECDDSDTDFYDPKDILGG